MSAITIIPCDKIVIVDGAPISGLDMSSLSIPEDTHALQWKDGAGWIETTEPSNIPITTLPEWAGSCVTLYEQAAAEIKSAKPQEPDLATVVKSERDYLLLNSDWTQLPDAPVDTSAWAAYRQALRDLPAQAGFPENVTWPTKPE